MLNRRKQPQDIGGHASDERQALLLGQDNNTAGQSRSASGDVNYVDSTSSTHLEPRRVPLIRSVSGPRKATYTLPDGPVIANTNSDAFRRPISHRLTSNSTNPSYSTAIHPQHFNQYQGDSYELTSVDRTDSRAIISIQSSSPCINNHKPSEFIVYTIQPGDTLHNLSVRYSCPVASIKRLNHLWSDQEFHGLRKIKLPVGKLRLIADVISEQESSASVACSGPHQPKPYERELVETLGNTISNHSIGNNTDYIQTTPKRVESVAQLLDDDTTGTLLQTDSLFKNFDQNIEKARLAARSYDDNANALMQTLAESGNLVANEDDETSEAQRQAEILLNDLSDFGLSYNFLILFIFIVCLAGPLAYVIYLEETHRDPHHHHHQQQQQLYNPT